MYYLHFNKASIYIPIPHTSSHTQKNISKNSCNVFFLFNNQVIGSAGAGKSCLLHQFIEGRFKEDSSHTIVSRVIVAQCLTATLYSFRIIF
jgi:ABC-type uncharacterized transport system ATPase component